MTAAKGQPTTRERPGDSLERLLAGGNRPHRGWQGLATHVGRIHQYTVAWIHPTMATKTSKRRIPPESARAGVQDDSLADHLVTDHGTETTMNPMIGMAVDGAIVQEGHSLQSCICGWKKITSEKGLRIHHGRKKCLREFNKGPRIDKYFLRGKKNKSSEAQWQDKHHSPQGIRTPKEAQSSTSPPFVPSPEPTQPQPAVEWRMDGHKPQILWPTSYQRKEWITIDTDLVQLLEGLKGDVERRL